MMRTVEGEQWYRDTKGWVYADILSWTGWEYIDGIQNSIRYLCVVLSVGGCLASTSRCMMYLAWCCPRGYRDCPALPLGTMQYGKDKE